MESVTSGADTEKPSEPAENRGRLYRLAGSWDVTVKYRTGGVEREGTATCDATLVLGGRALKQEYRTSFSRTPIHLVQYLSYEAHDRAGSGEAGSVFTLQGEKIDPVTGRATRLRVVTTILDRDHFCVEWFREIDGGRGEERFVTLNHTRSGKQPCRAD